MVCSICITLKYFPQSLNTMRDVVVITGGGGAAEEEAITTIGLRRPYFFDEGVLATKSPSSTKSRFNSSSEEESLFTCSANKSSWPGSRSRLSSSNGQTLPSQHELSLEGEELDV